jgi:multidrug efflux pump subunit AcrA (membrane-fusion protein)
MRVRRYYTDRMQYHRASRAVKRTPALPIAALLALSVALVAHEGHEGGEALYKELQAGGRAYRVGFAPRPDTPVVGEEVHLNLQVLELVPGSDPASTAGRPVRGRIMTMQIRKPDGSLLRETTARGGATAGVYDAHIEFASAADYTVDVSFDAGGPLRATFPLDVAPGPVGRAPLVGDALVLLLVAGLVGLLVRRPRGEAPPDAQPWGLVAALVVGGIVLGAIVHAWIAPAVGRLLLPQREDAPVSWEPIAAVEGRSPDTGAAPDAAPAAPPATPAGQTIEVPATAIPVPGGIADVAVPFASRVLFDGTTRPTIGRDVRKGETLAFVEPHYVLHDANHLINTRWPLMARMLLTKRLMLDSDLQLARIKYLKDAGGASAQALQAASTTAAEAHLEYQGAAKLLAMHDQQITEQGIVKKPVNAPISGTIEAVNFVQGQLAYEGDKLFTIVDLSHLWIEARVPERLVPHGGPLPRLAFTSPAFPGMTFTGKLARIANQVDPATRTVAYFFDVANPGRLLRAGMRLTGRIDPTTDAVGSSGRAGRADDVTPAVNRATPLPAPLTLQGAVRAKPDLTAQVTAPLWGRIEFAGRRLNVGDAVKKGETLINITLELSIDERYLMESRNAEISSELEKAKTRLTLAESQYKQSIALLRANPKDPFRREEVQLTEQIFRAATSEVDLLKRQAGSFKNTMERRDPKITPVQAPISGVITEVAFRPGELNTTGTFRRLLTIVDTSRVWIEARVFENDCASLLKHFGRASFSASGIAGERPLGRPVAISTTMDPLTNALTVTFDAPNPRGELKLGASTQIRVEPN